MWGAYPPSAPWWPQLGCFTRSPTIVGGSLPYLREDFTEAVHRSETCHLVSCEISGGTMWLMCMSPSSLCPWLPTHSHFVGPLISQRKKTEKEFLNAKNELWIWLKPIPPACRRHAICVQRVLSPWKLQAFDSAQGFSSFLLFYNCCSEEHGVTKAAVHKTGGSCHLCGFLKNVWVMLHQIISSVKSIMPGWKPQVFSPVNQFSCNKSIQKLAGHMSCP